MENPGYGMDRGFFNDYMAMVLADIGLDKNNTISIIPNRSITIIDINQFIYYHAKHKQRTIY